MQVGRSGWFVALVAIAAAGAAVVSGQQAGDATLVLRNGRVVTLDEKVPEAQAIAVRGDRILAVGSDADMNRHVGPATQVIDLRGQFAMPGFIEGHGHFMGVGDMKLRLNLMTAKNWDEVIAMVANAVKTAKPGEWIIGRGWHQEKWDKAPESAVNGFPTHEALSKVSPNNPVMLDHASGHALFANAKAMELANVDRETRNPAGGEIIKDARGRPIGIFNETAQRLVENAYNDYRKTMTPEQQDAEARQQIRLATEEVLSKGITSFQDAGSSFETIDLFKKVVDEKQLGVRLWVMIRSRPELLAKLLPSYRLVNYGGDNRLTVRAIKLTIDGALGSRGAWLLKPYADLPTTSGLNTSPLPVARETARLAIQHDFQFGVHAIGDRANREALNIFEEAFKANPARRDLRWRVEHAQHISAADIPRFGKLGVIASMQGIHCTSDAPYVLQRLGPERAEEGAYVWQKLMKSGAVVTNGTDAPVEDVDPIASYYATVTRRLANGTTFYPDQRMSRLEALRSYTLNPAFAAFEEGLKGSLTPGKLADITVLTRDITTVPDDEIMKAKVAMTIVGGQVAYDRTGAPEDHP